MPDIDCKIVLIDVPSELFNRAFGPANIVVIKSALQGDTWGAISTYCEFTQVSIEDLVGQSDRVSFNVRITVEDDKRDAAIRALRAYVADRFKCYRGASSVIRAEMPHAHPSALLRECYIDGVAVEAPPPPPAPRRVASPPPAPVREALTSPSREQHVGTHVRDSHLVALNDHALLERERRQRPAGGYKVNDLILGYLPPTAKHTTQTRAEHSYERDAYVGAELSKRHGFGPSQRVHHERIASSRYDYVDATGDDDRASVDYDDVDPRWKSHHHHQRHHATSYHSPAPAHPSSRAASTQRRVVVTEHRRSEAGPHRQRTPVRVADPAVYEYYDSAQEERGPSTSRGSAVRRSSAAAVDEPAPRRRVVYSYGAEDIDAREGDWDDDQHRGRSRSRSSRYATGREGSPSVGGRRYTTRGGQDMPRRY